MRKRKADKKAEKKLEKHQLRSKFEDEFHKFISPKSLRQLTGTVISGIWLSNRSRTAVEIC